MKTKLFFLVLLSWFVIKAKAESNYKPIIYNAYITNSIGDWKKVIDKMRSAKVIDKDEKLELLNYEYGYVGWCVVNNKDKEAQYYLDHAVKIAEELEKDKYELSQIMAYKAALWGFQIALSYYKAPFLGFDCVDFAKQSVQLNKNHYLGYLQLGYIDFFLPSVFGGSKTRAISNYIMAEKLLEKQLNGSLKDWNYINILVTIVQACQSLNQNAKAKVYHDKVMKVEPNYKWIKSELIDNLQNRTQK
jgi:hypothetical protein